MISCYQSLFTSILQLLSTHFQTSLKYVTCRSQFSTQVRILCDISIKSRVLDYMYPIVEKRNEKEIINYNKSTQCPMVYMLSLDKIDVWQKRKKKIFKDIIGVWFLFQVIWRFLIQFSIHFLRNF